MSPVRKSESPGRSRRGDPSGPLSLRGEFAQVKGRSPNSLMQDSWSCGFLPCGLAKNTSCEPLPSNPAADAALRPPTGCYQSPPSHRSSSLKALVYVRRHWHGKAADGNRVAVCHLQGTRPHAVQTQSHDCGPAGPAPGILHRPRGFGFPPKRARGKSCENSSERETLDTQEVPRHGPRRASA